MQVKLVTLQLWDKNPKDIDEQHFELLKKHIQKHPETVRLLIDGRDKKTILGGNQSMKVITKLGWKEVEVVYADIKSDQDAVEVALRDNMQYGSYIDNNLENLIAEFPELDLAEFEIEVTSITLEGMFEEIDKEVDYGEKNKEVDVNFIASELNCECPKCGFKFKS